ncbi:MAG: hypothetical protein ACE5K8_08665, partial [Candidatus Zixiibacteriota bacterium]
MLQFRKSLSIIMVVVLILIGVCTGAYPGLHPSYSEKAVADTVPFYEGGEYDPSVPKPNDFLEHPIGQWPQRYHEMAAYIKLLAERSERVVLETRGETHEGRDLFNIFISSSDNIANLEKHRADMDIV